MATMVSISLLLRELSQGSSLLADRHQQADAALNDVAGKISRHGPEIRTEKQMQPQFRRLRGWTLRGEPLPGLRRRVAPHADCEASLLQQCAQRVGFEQKARRRVARPGNGKHR